jgi:hypothetical protein
VRLDVDLHGVAHAERARDDVLVGEVALLLFRHVRLGFLVVLEQGMVARDLRDASGADAVAAAVADVRDVHLVAADQRGHDGRAHALVADVARRRLEDAVVRQLDAAHQAVLDVRERPVHLVRPGRVLVLGALVELTDRLGGELAGHLARCMATHAVGDDEQLLVFNEGKVILIVGSLHPDIGLGGVADLHGRSMSVFAGAGRKASWFQTLALES